jgi:hypothetical protein
MKNFLALVGALVIGVGGVGWYLGWYKVNVSKGSDGNTEIKTSVDTKKALDDSGEYLKKAGSLIGEQIDKTANDAKTPAGTPGPANASDRSVFWPVTGTGDTLKGTSPVAPSSR